jgi:hypothetical protein
VIHGDRAQDSEAPAAKRITMGSTATQTMAVKSAILNCVASPCFIQFSGFADWLHFNILLPYC